MSKISSVEKSVTLHYDMNTMATDFHLPALVHLEYLVVYVKLAQDDMPYALQLWHLFSWSQRVDMCWSWSTFFQEITNVGLKIANASGCPSRRQHTLGRSKTAGYSFKTNSLIFIQIIPFFNAGQMWWPLELLLQQYFLFNKTKKSELNFALNTFSLCIKTVFFSAQKF